MSDTATKILLVIFVVVVTSKTSEGDHFDYNPHFNHKNVTLETFIRLRRQASETSVKCKTPSQPNQGKWIYYNNREKGQAGTEVDEGTTIVFTCDSGYKLSSTNDNYKYSICLADGTWTSSVTHYCYKLCSPHYNTEIITSTCKNDDDMVPCDKATHGTVRTAKCAKYYEIPPGRPTTSTCVHGEWDFHLECFLECGNEVPPGPTLIVGSVEAVRGKYPWVTALYQNKISSKAADFQLICGGTLITLQIVLTAAHCVTQRETGEMDSAEYYRVGVGKYYRRYQDRRDIDTALYAEIEEIKAHPDYRAEFQNFRADIALLKLKKTLHASKNVLPTCYTDLDQLEPETIGLVTGWGFTTETKDQSEVLKELDLPYKDAKECFNSFRKDFALRFFTSDKLCAGFNNQSKGVCKGDSGGGLVFKNPRYDNKYFVHGIVSVSDTYLQNQELHCNVQKAALFTNVAQYRRWIQRSVLQWNLIRKNCITPKQPINGHWTYQNNRPDEPNISVVLDTIIVFSCDLGYQLSTTKETTQPVICTESGDWSLTEMPTCQVNLL